jgi:hypothetical protein
MKAKVLKRFRDKRNGKIYDADSIIEVSKERFDEIRKTDASLVEAVEEKAEEGKAEETAEKKPTKKAKTK